MIAGLLLLVLALASAPCEALTPRAIADVAFAPEAGTALPAHARFRDEDARAGELGTYFTQRPGIVVLGYYGCSNLCGLVLHGLAEGLTAADLHAGRDVEVVVVSIAPEETPAMAMARKRALASAVGDVNDVTNWHFLTGDEASIGALRLALGYRAAYDADTAQYAHAAGVTLVARGGIVRAMLPGIVFPASALRASVMDGTPAPMPASVMDSVPAAASRAAASPATAASRWLLCFHYDPQTGRYSFAAMNAMRLAALAALAGLFGYIVRARWREARRHSGARS